MIDTATNTVLTSVPVGDAPLGVATDDRGGRVYVTNLLADTVSVINAGTNRVIATISVGSSPAGVAVI